VTPLAPRASAPPLPPPTGARSSAPPSLHDLPAFPLDEIEPDDVEEDEEDVAANHRSASDPVELPMKHGLGSKMVDSVRDVGESLRPFAERAKQRIGPLAGRAKGRLSPLAGRTKHWLTDRVAPKLEEGFAYVKANPKDPKVLLGLGGGALLILLLLIAVAAATGSKEPAAKETTEATEPKSSLAPAASVGAAKGVTSAVAVESRPASNAACRLTKEASRLAGKASKDVPLEIAVSSTGERARVGFATDAGSAQGLAVDLATLKVTQEFSAPTKGKVRAVVPLGAEGRSTYVVNGDGPGDKMHAWRTLSSQSLLVIGWAAGAISVGSQATDTPVAVWPLEGDDPPDAIRVASAGDLGQAVVFRRQGQIFGGMIDRDQKPRGDLVRIAGAGAPSGATVGTPVVATNPHAVAVAFADRASSSEPWGVRIGSVPLGSMPTQTRAFAVPSGGPGGAAIAPALAGLPDGRWLLVWTEGGGGDHDVRAQTLDAELRPKGAPFAVSHESNAGQGAVALAAGQGLVAYLTLTDQGYELWGAAVDCR
jgi:hypothetical protein